MYQTVKMDSRYEIETCIGYYIYIITDYCLLTYNFIGSIASCRHLKYARDVWCCAHVRRQGKTNFHRRWHFIIEAIVACYSAACHVSEKVFLFGSLLLFIATEFSITVLKAIGSAETKAVKVNFRVNLYIVYVMFLCSYQMRCLHHW